jgi:hypothetical protein
MSRWSLHAVEKAAPDAASLAAGRKLATPGPWSDLGSTDVLLWGRCQGSGKTPYQVSIDLTGPAYRCSCPSRKFPCKHAIALLLLWVSGDGSVADVPEGADFARTWAETRAQRGAERATRTEKASDPEAQARRLEDRLRLMDAGVAEFSLWLADLVRAGTVEAKRRPLSWWESAGARLVDAQLPGLADRVRSMGTEVNRREDWAEHLLEEVGRWWTATRAWVRRDELDDLARADLRAFLGWATPTEEVRAEDAVDGRWQVLGAHRSDDGRLQQQRTWLREAETGETVVVLDFAPRNGPLPAARLIGSVLAATIARYPGGWPRRALFVGEPAVVGTDTRLPRGVVVDEALGQLAQARAANPWVARVPVVLEGATLGATAVVDSTGSSLPVVQVADQWTLHALSGGRPTTIFGEVEDAGFRPLSLDLAEVGEVR